ncbi:DUF2157 domain-containing protein [Verminephrobacter eiseniae]|nr:DUF2157 domain-containing protein [Verminephrobacter eiseniae]MCW5303744.1 DUF2157 domain-containing protein [Verminephrobacter eiseniae]MCW8181061.1 DUF2157 domain-containing protein [Verminephrobacter eiseniae]MCW8191540.1 DUF2157 domain-containing protein [Verminephrobacter eiseniae]
MRTAMQTNVSDRIVLERSDVLAAADDGVITQAQAQSLWQRWSSAPAMAPGVPAGRPGGPTFGFVNVLYYFGGLLAIGALTLFMTRGWERFGAAGLLVISVVYALGCLMVADHFRARSLPVPAGILAALAVCLVPLAVWCVQRLLGLWPPGDGFFYRDYHTVISWRWMTLELATLAMGVVMLWRYRLPFMVMPIAITIWYMSMDMANGLMQREGFDWELSRDVSLLFGIATCCVAIWVDMRCRRATQARERQDFAFWLYLVGAIMFWGGLSLRDSARELDKFIYALINVALVLFGAAIGRRVFTILGGLGVAYYLGHLSYRVFKDSLLFPFVLTLLGLGVVCLGVWWQRHEGAINARLSRFVPQGLRR